MRIARCRDGGRRAVETYDIATTLIELENGASGVIALNRSAWGRKGRIFVQLFGAKGTIVFDQERMNEVQLYTADGPKETPGLPHHPRRARSIRLTTNSFRRRAMGSASTI